MNMPIIDMRLTGQNIRQLRVKNLLKVNDLQRIFGFAQPNAIYKWEKGVSLPTIDNLLVLSKIFGVTMDEIIVCRRV